MPARQTLSLPNIQLSYLGGTKARSPYCCYMAADHAGVWSSLGDHLAQRYHIAPRSAWSWRKWQA